MSLRDDLNTLENALHAYAGSLSLDGSELEALDRLRAALTPAAIKWLEALPELMKLMAGASWGVWSSKSDGSITTDQPPPFSMEHRNLVAFQHVAYAPESNRRLIVALQNALHRALVEVHENLNWFQKLFPCDGSVPCPFCASKKFQEDMDGAHKSALTRVHSARAVSEAKKGE